MVLAVAAGNACAGSNTRLQNCQKGRSLLSPPPALVQLKDNGEGRPYNKPSPTSSALEEEGGPRRPGNDIVIFRAH